MVLFLMELTKIVNRYNNVIKTSIVETIATTKTTNNTYGNICFNSS